jgi:hypothetical protein
VPDLEIQNRCALGVERINALAAGPHAVRLSFHDGNVMQVVVRLTPDEALTLAVQLIASLPRLSFGRA